MSDPNVSGLSGLMKSLYKPVPTGGVLGVAAGCSEIEEPEKISSDDTPVGISRISFVAAWESSGHDICDKPADEYVLNQVSRVSGNVSLNQAIAQQVFEQVYFRDKFKQLNKAQQELAITKLAEKLKAGFGRKTLADLPNWPSASHYAYYKTHDVSWLPTYGRPAADKNVLPITFKDVKDSLKEAAKEIIDDKCKPTQIVQTVAVTNTPSLTGEKAKPAGKPFSLPVAYLQYADKAAAPTLPSDCKITAIGEEVGAKLIEIPPETAKAIEKKPEEGAKEAFNKIAVKPMLFNIVPQGKITIPSAAEAGGIYGINLVCTKPEPGFEIEMGEVEVKEPVVRRPVVGRPGVTRPVVKKPVVKKPVVKKPGKPACKCDLIKDGNIKATCKTSNWPKEEIQIYVDCK